VRRDILAVVHSGYWGVYLLLVSLFLAIVRGPQGGQRSLGGLWMAWPIVLIAFAPSAAAFYASYGPLFSRFLARRRMGGLLAGGVGVALAAAAFGLALALLLFGIRQPVFTRAGEVAGLTLSLAAMAALHVAGALLVRGFVGWYAGSSEAPVLESQPAPACAGETIHEPAAPAPLRDVIFVKTEQRLEKIRLDEIVLIEGQRDYRRIHTTDRRIMTLQTFAEFERQLPSDTVCRVHKSYMVAVNRIDSIERGRIAIQGLTVPISETYRDQFFALIGHR